ncbi:hypothetical protein AAVH_25920 [Aphelenchoides avenae]|nr:hypothetical protein AAVH_25920 [Aphelenchus avenae]
MWSVHACYGSDAAQRVAITSVDDDDSSAPSGQGRRLARGRTGGLWRSHHKKSTSVYFACASVNMSSFWLALLILLCEVMVVLTKPSTYADLTERQMDDYSDAIGRIFPETKHPLRTTTFRQWRAKFATSIHLGQLEQRRTVDTSAQKWTDLI